MLKLNSPRSVASLNHASKPQREFVAVSAPAWCTAGHCIWGIILVCFFATVSVYVFAIAYLNVFELLRDVCMQITALLRLLNDQQQTCTSINHCLVIINKQHPTSISQHHMNFCTKTNSVHPILFLRFRRLCQWHVRV